MYMPDMIVASNGAYLSSEHMLHRINGDVKKVLVLGGAHYIFGAGREA